MFKDDFMICVGYESTEQIHVGHGWFEMNIGYNSDITWRYYKVVTNFICSIYNHIVNTQLKKLELKSKYTWDVNDLKKIFVITVILHNGIAG